jgi:hypothetical protein
VAAGYCQRVRVYESGMIRTQMGSRIISDGRSVWDAMCDATPSTVTVLCSVELLALRLRGQVPFLETMIFRNLFELYECVLNHYFIFLKYFQLTY